MRLIFGVHEFHLDVTLRDRLDPGAFPAAGFEVSETISVPPFLHFHDHITQRFPAEIANDNSDAETRAYCDPSDVQQQHDDDGQEGQPRFTGPEQKSEPI
jgi:hypothetical protein